MNAIDIGPRRRTALGIEAGQEGHTYVIRCSGELDESSADQLESALIAAESTEAARILVDLNALEFIDSTGLRVLVSAKRRSDSDRRRLRMTRGTGEIAKLFQLTALDQSLPFI